MKKFKVNKIKVMVFKRAKEQTIDFVQSSRVKAENTTECKIWLREEKMEEGTVLCKNGRIQGESSAGQMGNR